MDRQRSHLDFLLHVQCLMWRKSHSPDLHFVLQLANSPPQSRMFQTSFHNGRAVDLAPVNRFGMIDVNGFVTIETFSSSNIHSVSKQRL